MATNSQIAFNPQGKTVVVAAAGTAPAGVQASVNSKFDAQATGQVRIVNAGANIAHVGVGASASEAAANAVAATAGSPASGIPILPGTEKIVRVPLGSYFSGVATIATTLYITPGEGL